MSQQGDVAGLGLPPGPIHHGKGVFNFVGYGHVAKLPVAPSVGVEIEAQHADALGKQVAGDAVEERSAHVARESVAEDDDVAALAGLRCRKLKTGSEPPHGACDVERGVGLRTGAGQDGPKERGQDE